MCSTLRRHSINLMNWEEKVLKEIMLICEIIFLHTGSSKIVSLKW